jgi:hypothetical protein
MPIGDRQIRQGGRIVERQGNRLVEQRQAPDGPATVEDTSGFPFDVGLGEDRFDDLAHFPVPDDGVAVLVDRQHRPGVGPADRFPALDGLVVHAAIGADPGGGVDVGGDRVPVQPGQDAGFGPGAGESPSMMPSWCQGICRTENIDSAFAGMPATPFMRVDQNWGDSGLPGDVPAPGV